MLHGSKYTDDQIFIPIISDYGFKATFGNEANTLFLRRALQALIKSEVPIKEVKFDKNTFEASPKMAEVEFSIWLVLTKTTIISL